MVDPRKDKAQIATIIVFIIAVIFLFILVTMNMSTVAHKKTAVDNVADSVGLQEASMLGSIAYSMKRSVGMADDTNEDCALNWDTIKAAILFIAAAVATVVSLGVASEITIPIMGYSVGVAAIAGTSAVGLAIGGGLSLGSSLVQTYLATTGSAVSGLKLKFQTMSIIQQVMESPIQGCFLGLVDDPAWVNDTVDMDQDHDTGDKAPRFLVWYSSRLNAIPRVGAVVENFLTRGFPSMPDRGSFFTGLNLPEYPTPVRTFQRRFQIAENAQTWLATDAKWVVDLNGFIGSDGLVHSGDNSRNYNTPLTSWLATDTYSLRNMLTELRNYGYGINLQMTSCMVAAPKPDTITDNPVATAHCPLPPPYGMNYEFVAKFETKGIDFWVSEIQEFENKVVKSLHDMDLDTAMSTTDVWVEFLTNTGKGDWFRRLTTLYNQVRALKSELIARADKIHNCVYDCKAKAYNCGSATDSCTDLSCRAASFNDGCVYNCTAMCGAPGCPNNDLNISGPNPCRGTCRTQCCAANITACNQTNPSCRRVTNTTTTTLCGNCTGACGNAVTYPQCRNFLGFCQGGTTCYTNTTTTITCNSTKCCQYNYQNRCCVGSYDRYNSCVGPDFYCGQLCGGANCRPYSYCANGLRSVANGTYANNLKCCDVVPLEPYNRYLASPVQCFYSGGVAVHNRNIIECYPCTSATWYNVPTVLERMARDLEDWIHLIYELKQTIDPIRVVTYNNFHEAFYVWSDFVGGLTSQKQEVGHVVYSRIDLPNDANFTLPWFDTQPCALYFGTATVLKNHTGEFTLTVGRYDEDTTKRSPLQRFWRFIFSRGVSEAESDQVRNIAAKYRSATEANPPRFYGIGANHWNNARGDLIETTNYNTLRSVIHKGIVSKVKVKYGPNKEDISLTNVTSGSI
jgi:hypothetical protein